MSERERYRLLFRQSKGVIKDWEAQFTAAHQRKPLKTEVSSAPEKVILAYKNCRKIKLFFERDEQQRKTEKENAPEELGPDQSAPVNLNFSGLFPRKPESTGQTAGDDDSAESTACQPSQPKGVWGKHLNKKVPANKTESSGHKLVGKLSFSSESNSTRSSMKKRSRSDKKSLSFFGTLDDSTLGDLSQSSIFDDLSQSQSSFLPEEATSEAKTGGNHTEREGEQCSRVLSPKDTNSREETLLEMFPCASTVTPAPVMASKPTSGPRQDRRVNDAWLTRCAEVDADAPPPSAATSSSSAAAAAAVTMLMSGDPGGTLLTETKAATSQRKASLSDCPKPPPSTNMKEGSKEAESAVPKGPTTSFSGLFAAESELKKREPVSALEPVVVAHNNRAVEPDEPLSRVAKQTRTKKKRKRSADSDQEYSPGQNDRSDSSPPPAAARSKGRRTGPTKRPVKRRKPNKGPPSPPPEEESGDRQAAAAPEPSEQGPSRVNLFALGFEEGEETGPTSVKTFMTPEQRLANNLATGKANENYKKIDLKKKSYSKGKGAGRFIKNMEFKRKLAAKEGKSLKEYKCYRCGELGHFSNQCTGGKGDSLIPQELADQFDAGEFPSLEDAQRMAQGTGSRPKPVDPASASSSTTADGEAESRRTIMIDDEDDAVLLEAVKQYEMKEAEEQSLQLSTQPYLQTEDNFDSDLIDRTLKMFGYDDFRPGQKEGIMRILEGKSSLVLLATGSGKSLIYQLPAYLYSEKYNSITIVVSPLVSLMEDQVTGLPPFLRAAALHYNLTPKMKEKVVEQVKSGKLHFLLVSPESVAGGGGVFGSLIPHLPPIAFVCIDEAHCVSQWSHNFRPSYLRLSKIIREKLGVQTILGLTATAPERMITNVADQLGVPAEGVIRGPLLPNNLQLSVSRDANRESALLALLSEDGALADCESVIVYCTKRDDCVKVATFLRTRLQEREFELSERRKNKTRMSATAEPYHAGLPASRRRTVQNHFMSGKLRIVVATVAFGMGIDKSDIRAIVHYNMPKAYESYIQEIGRAGRDGKLARCHLFLETEGRDLAELKRHVFANSMDRFTLRKLLHLIFTVADESDKPGADQDYKEVAISVVDTVEALDMPEENISTLLCYLESSGDKARGGVTTPWVKLQNPVYSHCRVQCYGGPLQLRSIASSCPPLAAAIALQRQKGADFSGASSVEFPVVEVSARMNWKSGVVKKELKNLEWKSTPAGWRKTGVVVNFSNLAFHFEARQGLSETQLDQLQHEIYERSRHQEYSELSNLLRLHRAFTLVAFKTHEEAGGEMAAERSLKLKEYVTSYFREPERILDEAKVVPETCEDEGEVRGYVRAFVYDHRDHNWNGRAVARVFHGIQSPNFPAKQWGRTNSWRALLRIDFNLLVKLASDEILKIRTGG